nr:uncharacterized protein LOC111424077 [Onthophagus taurus]
MKFVFLIISIGVACEALSASHRHHIKKHHHELRDGDPTSTEISSDSPTETTTSQIYPPILGPGPVLLCHCGVICRIEPVPIEITETTETIYTAPTETSQRKRHMFHNKKIFNAANKKHHHAVRNDIKKRYVRHYCFCRRCPKSTTTKQPDVSTISQEPTVVNPGPSYFI